MDLAVGAGHDLLVMHGRDRKLSLDQSQQAKIAPVTTTEQSFPFAIVSIARGDFIRDEAHQTDIALLSGDGAVHVLANPNRSGAHRGEPSVGVPLSEHTKSGGWSREMLTNDEDVRPLAATHRAAVNAGAHREARLQDSSQWSEAWRSEILMIGSWPQARRLLAVNTSSLPTDDLVVLDQSSHQLHILTTDDERRTAGNEQLATSNKRPTTLDVVGTPVAVLPMRLNVDALSDLVILRQGSSAPTVALTVVACTFTVNSTLDAADAALNGVCDDGAGNCTLRAAIQEANNTVAADTICFNIPGAGPHTISPSSALPTITQPVTIDATDENACGNPHCVVLDGSGAGTADGLKITGGSSTVRGLVINQFTGDGIELGTTGGNIIEGNFIGTDVSGTMGLGNSDNGVHIIGVSNNLIGGTTVSARNVVSGNSSTTSDGLDFVIGGTDNMVQGNYIGTAVNGVADIGNASDGVEISDATVTVGGTTTGARNIISGNNGSGIAIFLATTTGVLVHGNYIGTDVTGNTALGNSFDGVIIDTGATNNTIGGTTTAARNVISGNGSDGVQINGSATGNMVQGNFIGTQANGTSPLGNIAHGVFITRLGRLLRASGVMRENKGPRRWREEERRDAADGGSARDDPARDGRISTGVLSRRRV